MQETTFSLAFQMVGLSSKSINTTVNINFNKPLYLSKNWKQHPPSFILHFLDYPRNATVTYSILMLFMQMYLIEVVVWVDIFYH